MIKFNIIGIFNELIQNYLSHGVVGRAINKKLLEVEYLNLREFTTDVHQSVDDKPFGGCDGMLMSYLPLEKALKQLDNTQVVYLSPRGRKFNSVMAQSWAQKTKPITLISGRYAGVDERLIQNYVHEEVSIGDFVLSGGEVAAMAIVDAVARFVPGVLGSNLSSQKDSFSDTLLEGPQFTRPQEVGGFCVPQVLTSGHHIKIQEFNRHLAILTSLKMRPDLIVLAIEKNQISKQDVESAFQYLRNKLTPSEQIACGFHPRAIELCSENWKEIK